MRLKTFKTIAVTILVASLIATLGVILMEARTNQREQIIAIEELTVEIHKVQKALTHERGDVDGDGKVSIGDYTALRLHVVGYEEDGEIMYRPLKNPEQGDVTGNGKVDEFDLEFMRIIVLEVSG